MPSSLHTDTLLKVRQLEMSLLDFKGMMDRKMLRFTEELPQQVRREFTTLQAREEQILKDVGIRFQGLQEASIRTRDALKQRQGELGD